jgi:hypothetical protein
MKNIYFYNGQDYYDNFLKTVHIIDKFITSYKIINKEVIEFLNPDNDHKPYYEVDESPERYNIDLKVPSKLEKPSSKYKSNKSMREYLYYCGCNSLYDYMEFIYIMRNKEIGKNDNICRKCLKNFLKVNEKDKNIIEKLYKILENNESFKRWIKE